MLAKYTKEILQEAVSKSYSVFDILRYLKLKITGGSHSHIKKLIKKYGIDTGHFKGQGWSRGQEVKVAQLKPDDLLILDRKSGRKEAAYRLRRALKDVGVTEKCAECHLGTIWNGKPITLEIDHINGNPFDNQRFNLRFICPNCHSQTANYGSKNIKRK